MTSNLISIGRSGAAGARIALDLTAQNIANAATPGYVRRTANMVELATAGGPGRSGDLSLSGVRLGSIVRNADPFRQAEVRRTGGDQARADAELSALENVQSAIEQSGVDPAIVSFVTSLNQLASDPTNPSLRAAVIENARTLAKSFNIASQQLDAAGQGMATQSGALVDQTNSLASDLAQVNLSLSRSSSGTSDQTMLLDRRDAILQSLSETIGISTTFDAKGAVTVRVGGSGGPPLVALGTAQSLVMTVAANGTLGFSIGATAVDPASGALAGKAQALVKLASTRTGLDGVAASLITTLNQAQANGVALDGSPGQPLLSGTKASDIALLLNNGAALATAPAGAPAGSRDASNLAALRTALSTNDPARQFDTLLFDLSSLIAGRGLTRDALSSIAASARDALSAEAGVNLDQEAVNLVRFQQAFQASGRVIQVASTLFDTLLSIR